jgi:HlyD family secretion protein
VSQVRLQAKTQENVVTYTVVVRVDNPDLTLKPGMTANVAIRVAEASGVLRVPAAALRFRPGNGNGEGKRRAASPPGDGGGEAQLRAVVWVLQEGQERPLRRVPVEVGLTDGTWTAVSGT